MPPTSTIGAGKNGRSEPPHVPATRISTRNRRNGLTASLYVVDCPGCGQPRRHTQDGLRACPCGQAYQLVVTAVIGTEAA